MNADYKNLFLDKNQFLIDNTTNFADQIVNIVNVINEFTHLNKNWVKKDCLQNLSEQDLIEIQDSVSNDAQEELVKIIKPYVEPKIVELFGKKQEINIRVSAQIKSRWKNEVLNENRRVILGKNGFNEHENKPNMAFPTRAHQDLDNNGNRSSHVIIFYFQMTENYENCSMLQIGNIDKDLCIIDNDMRNGYPNEMTSRAQNEINWLAPKIKPGDISLMSPLTIHRSTPISEIPRIALNVKFQPTTLDYIKLIYNEDLDKIKKISDRNEKLILLKSMIDKNINKNRGLSLEKATISLLLNDRKSFYDDIRKLFTYEISQKNLDKIAAGCILRKSVYFVNDNDLKCLNNPIENFVDKSCASSILKTIN